jgi:hypothetical protein
MNLFARGCKSHQAYLALPARLGPRERVDLEVHALCCAECADALRNGRPLDVALRDAFAPLRERRTIIAPGRVRLAVRSTYSRPNQWWLRVPRLLGRLSEVSIMVGVALLAVGSSLDWSTKQPAATMASQSVVQQLRVEPPSAEIDYLRWLRLGKSDANLFDPTLSAGGRFR